MKIDVSLKQETNIDKEMTNVADENGLKKTKRIQRKKTLRDTYHDLDRSDMNDNPNGEAEIKAEDDWILDVYDSYYDEEDMQR